MRKRYVYVMYALLIHFVLLSGYVFPDDQAPDLSSPEALYERLVEVVRTKNVDLLWQCTDKYALQVFGKTKNDQVIYMKNNLNKITEKIRLSELYRIEIHLNNPYFEAEIWMIRDDDDDDGDKKISSFFARRENGEWKTTIPHKKSPNIQKSE